jgi:hypothetical protein
MTTDERLDQLAERHQALADSVALLHAEQRAMRREYEERFAKNEERLGQIMEAIGQLAHVAEIHEEIDDLDADRS